MFDLRRIGALLLKPAPLAWFAVVLWCGVLFFLSSRPSSSLPKIRLFPHQDKAVHVALYIPLGLLLARASVVSGARRRRLIIVSATMGSLAYGLTDEIHQLYVPGRSFDLLDLLADGIGGFLGAWGYVRLAEIWHGSYQLGPSGTTSA